MARMVVTADMLDDLRREGKDITIPTDALITPAARDWLKENALPITWSDGPGDLTNGAARLGLVIDETQPAQRSMAINLERAFGRAERFDPGKNHVGLIDAVGRLCQAVRESRLTNGVVFTECGSLAACLANKTKGVRAAVVSSIACADEAIRLLGINVLIIETQQTTYHQIRQMVTRFLQGSRKADDAVAAAVNELEGTSS